MGALFNTPLDFKEEQSHVLAKNKQLKVNWLSTVVVSRNKSHPYEAEVLRWIVSMKWGE